jgi:hypothetical protein
VFGHPEPRAATLRLGGSSRDTAGSADTDSDKQRDEIQPKRAEHYDHTTMREHFGAASLQTFNP